MASSPAHNPSAPAPAPEQLPPATTISPKLLSRLWPQPSLESRVNALGLMGEAALT